MLRWLENTIEGQAKRFIQDAFAVIDPGKACDVIWETLEEVYGKKDMIIENAIQQIKRPLKSIDHNRKALLELRADLRNLKGVAVSVGLESKLKAPQILGKLYSTLSDKLRNKFDVQYPANKWSFEQFIEFLSSEITHVDSLHLMKVDSNDNTQHRGKEDKTLSYHVRHRNQVPMRIAAAVQDSKDNPCTSTSLKRCALHPTSDSHTLVQCKRFLLMDEKDRWQVVKDNQLCFACLENGHMSKTCKVEHPCKSCHKRHHALLHPTGTESISKSALQSPTLQSKIPTKLKAAPPLRTDRRNVLGFMDQGPIGQVGLMILTALPTDDQKETLMFYAAIDTGATQSLCSRRLAELLYDKSMPVGCKEYSMFDGCIMKCEFTECNLNLAKKDGTNVIFESMTFIDHELPFARYLPESSTLPLRVDMIIGGDLAWKHILSGQSLAWQEKSNIADHELGTLWLSSGKNCALPNVTLNSLRSRNQSRWCASKVKLGVEDRGQALKALENDLFYHSPIDDKLTMSRVDEAVLKRYQDTVQLVTLDNGESHLQFSLPWARDPAIMRENYQQAKNVLLKLRGKLEGQPELAAKYCEKIETAIDKGHIVRVPDKVLQEEDKNPSKPRYYIPHFNTSQSKFRVVYDAAREYHGISLNGLLERCPIFMQSLRSILIRFGEKMHGIAGDIANMFFQIRIAPEDRDMLRILWFDGPELQGNVVVYRFQVAPYGLRCSPSIAGYSLLYTAERNIPDVSHDVTERVTRDMFVDDLITGVNFVEEGKRVINEVSKLLSSTGFQLTKWNSSDKEILAEIPEEDLAPARRDITEKTSDSRSDKPQTTLGLVWDTDTDEFFLKKPTLKIDAFDGKKFTKRQVVSLNNGLFDPLSWWAPLYIQMNVSCSAIVRQVEEWDEVVPDGLAKQWLKAIGCLKSLDQVPIPRRKIPDVLQLDGRCEFHMFADSSKDVAAAAVYLRVIYGEQTYVHLIAARTSLHSKSEMTRESMPRKEIIALDLGARLLKECLDATSLTVDDYELWSDSQTVIQWCRTKTLELRVFERNRVDLILKNSNGKFPQYIPSGQNPADVATRPCRVEDAERWSLWLNGPEFLQHPHFPWQENCVKLSVADQNAIVSTSTASTMNKPFNDEQQFMQYTLNRTNNLAKVLRVVSNVLQCFTKWKQKTFNLTTGSPQHNDADDPYAAKRVLIRSAQTDCFSSVLSKMRQNLTFEEAVSALSTQDREPWMYSIQKLVPYLDPDGILRVGGRLDYNDDFRDELKHPAILPKRHKVTQLFILERHEHLGHRAAETVLASLSNDEGLKVIGGAQTVRSYLSDCFTCKLLRKSRGQQLMAPLPEYRVTPRQAVFTSVSLDYAGPFEVKRGRSTEKRWICIFVCNATTAVRLEMVESLHTSAFLNAFRRFLCLTGWKTKHLRSDCSTTFRGACNVLKKEEEHLLKNLYHRSEVEAWMKNKSIFGIFQLQ